MKENSSHKEDKLFRDKLEELDFEYNYQDWKEIESRLESSSRIARIKKLGFAAAIIGSISVLVWNYSSKEIESQKDFVESSIENLETYNSNLSNRNVETKKELKIDSRQAEDNYNQEDIVKNDSEENPISIKIEAEELPKETSNHDKTKVVVTSNYEEKIAIDSIQLIGKPCNGSSVTLTAHHSSNSYSGNYTWTVNGKEISVQEKSISYLITSEENILVEVWMNNQVKLSRKIKISKIESPDFTYLDNEGPYNDFKVNFTSNSTKLSHIWRIDNQVIEPHESEFEYIFKNEGLYDVELIVINEKECSASIKKPISVTQNFDVLAPNAFTPDGDGLNDDFIPHGFLNRDDLFKMEIFDISGKLVYSTNSTTQPWNGNFNNTGEKLLEGMYIWKVSISNTKNQSNAYAGSVRLIRKN
jgi:gliding motility-associated-like protein